MSISIDRELAKELIDAKLREIDQLILSILNKYQMYTIEDVFDAGRKGKLSEDAIDDCIDLQNLHEKRKRYQELMA